MNENHIGYRIRQHLNQGLTLGNEASDRLRLGREQALQKQKVTVYATANAWAGNVLGRMVAPEALLPRVVLPAVVLVVGLLAINTWQQTQAFKEIEEIDVAVLAGDLPIDAYLDKGFDAWLKRSSQ